MVAQAGRSSSARVARRARRINPGLASRVPALPLPDLLWCPQPPLGLAGENVAGNGAIGTPYDLGGPTTGTTMAGAFRHEIERLSGPGGPASHEGGDATEGEVQHNCDEEEKEKVSRDPADPRLPVHPVRGTAGQSPDHQNRRDNQALHHATPIGTLGQMVRAARATPPLGREENREVGAGGGLGRLPGNVSRMPSSAKSRCSQLRSRSRPRNSSRSSRSSRRRSSFVWAPAAPGITMADAMLSARASLLMAALTHRHEVADHR